MREEQRLMNFASLVSAESEEPSDYEKRMMEINNLHIKGDGDGFPVLSTGLTRSWIVFSALDWFGVGSLSEDAK